MFDLRGFENTIHGQFGATKTVFQSCWRNPVATVCRLPARWRSGK